MPFKKGQGVIYQSGNAVAMEDESGGQVKIKIVATGVVSSVAAGELKYSYWAGAEPNLWESAVNIAVFEAEQLLLKGKGGLMDRDAVAFVIEEVVYEFFVKDYVSFLNIMEVKSSVVGADRDWFSMQGFNNAINKSIAVGLLIDSIYRALRRQEQVSKARMTYLLKMAVAFFAGNVISRKFIAPTQAEYMPQ